jgi:hypothetical protein
MGCRAIGWMDISRRGLSDCVSFHQGKSALSQAVLYQRFGGTACLYLERIYFENGDRIFLRNVGNDVQDCTMLFSRRPQSNFQLLF